MTPGVVPTLPHGRTIQPDADGMVPRLTPHQPDPVADRDDVARAAGGDLGAFERLYRTHLARVHSLTRRMAGADQADELTQDVFIRVWQKLGSFRGDSAFTTWLHRLAVNVVIERFRSAAASRLRFIEDADLAAMSSVEPVPHTDRMSLETALGRLPEGARRIFVLHDVEGYKHNEIAEMLSIAPGTSKAQLHRARMLMRRTLR